MATISNVVPSNYCLTITNIKTNKELLTSAGQTITITPDNIIEALCKENATQISSGNNNQSKKFFHNYKNNKNKNHNNSYNKANNIINTIKCFNCGSNGHMARNCKKPLTNKIKSILAKKKGKFIKGKKPNFSNNVKKSNSRYKFKTKNSSSKPKKGNESANIIFTSESDVTDEDYRLNESEYVDHIYKVN